MKEKAAGVEKSSRGAGQKRREFTAAMPETNQLSKTTGQILFALIYLI